MLFQQFAGWFRDFIDTLYRLQSDSQLPWQQIHRILQERTLLTACWQLQYLIFSYFLSSVCKKTFLKNWLMNDPNSQCSTTNPVWCAKNCLLILNKRCFREVALLVIEKPTFHAGFNNLAEWLRGRIDWHDADYTCSNQTFCIYSDMMWHIWF